MSKIKVKFGQYTKDYDLIPEPHPHFLVNSNKEMHGWTFYDYQKNGLRECSQERLLINPYNGCAVDCIMCYTKTMGGYFQTFWSERQAGRKGPIAVFENYDKVIEKQLSKLYIATCGYVSPITDPFQPIENKYHLSEKIFGVFSKLDLPCEFITKMGKNVPDRVYELISSHPYKHSFCQYTILTNHNDILREISPIASKYEEQLAAISRANEFGIKNIVARLDPIFPFATDDPNDINIMMKDIKNAGGTHVIMSCVDIPRGLRVTFFELIEKISNINEIKKLYKNDQVISGDLNASLKYRHKLFQKGRELAAKNNLTFSMCMEFEKYQKNNEDWYKGFNDLYMTSPACEGIEIPIYYRTSLKEKFRPFSKISNCNGNCLEFAKKGSKALCKGDCKIPTLQKAGGLTLKDYRQFKIPEQERNLLEWYIN